MGGVWGCTLTLTNKRMLYRHSKHDWGDVGEESWTMNDEAAEAKRGSILRR